MTIERKDVEVLELALEALESWQKTCLDCGRPSEELGRATKPIAIIKEALLSQRSVIQTSEWKGLTKKEKEHLWEKGCNTFFIEKIESLLKEKNTRNGGCL